MGSPPLVHECFASDGGAGIPNVPELGLVEADERYNKHVALEPENDLSTITQSDYNFQVVSWDGLLPSVWLTCLDHSS
jgi:hypothetical protein